MGAYLRGIYVVVLDGLCDRRSISSPLTACYDKNMSGGTHISSIKLTNVFFARMWWKLDPCDDVGRSRPALLSLQIPRAVQKVGLTLL
jgi:hypothetical protein